MSPFAVVHPQQVSVVGVVPVQPAGALLVLAVGISRRQGEHGVLVVRLQQGLSRLAVENGEILFEELPDQVLSLLVAQKGLLGGRHRDFFLYVETYWWGQINTILTGVKKLQT